MENVFEDCRASQNKVELKWLSTMLLEQPRKVVLEIGAWRGYSMEVWFKLLRPEFLISIENDAEVLEFLDGRIARGELSYITPEPIIIRGTSYAPEIVSNVIHMLGGRQLDFLFIDGDHRYDAVKKDFEAYAPLVKKGGIIAFHDVGLEGQKWDEAGVQVKKFFNEVKKDYKHAQYQDEEGKGTGTGMLYV